jgi:flagellar protein FliS
MTTKKTVPAAYLQNNVMTASPVKLVKLLYEGALRHMEVARIELSSKETSSSAKAGESLGRSLAILGELRASLDMQAGAAISTDLDRLYEFAIHSISEANIHRDPKPLESSIKVVRTLKGAWDELAGA